MLTRRGFSKSLLGCSSALLAIGASAQNPLPSAEEQRAGLKHGGRTPFSSGFGPGQDIDVLIKGGTVIDPSQQLHAEMDVAVKNGKILEVSKDIPESRARGVLSARGKIVTPGWIDLHVHCFDVDGYTVGRDADHYCLSRGVTTCVDAGSTGNVTLVPFVKNIIPASATRIYPLLHMGMGSAFAATTEASHHYRYGGRNLELVNPALTIKGLQEHRPPVVGIKVHLGEGAYDNVKENEWKLLQMTVETAEACHVPFMVHALACYYSTAQILKLFRKGDVYTHCYHSYGRPNVILDGNGRILPEVRDARQRGVWFDTGDAHKEIDFDYIEKALQQDFLPDSVSTNLHADAEYDLVYDLPTHLSRYMAVGISLDKAIELVTIKPAQVFNYGVQIGTLRPGSEADVGIFELHEGQFVFVDGKEQRRTGHQLLVNSHVICRGQLFSNKSANFPTDPPWRYST